MDDESEGIAEQYEHRNAYPIREATDIHSFHFKALRETDVFFHYDSDLSGDVIIMCDDDKVEIKIPGRALIEFVASYVARQKISRLEQMEPEELLDIK